MSWIPLLKPEEVYEEMALALGIGAVIDKNI